jgi:hypothetical protein
MSCSSSSVAGGQESHSSASSDAEPHWRPVTLLHWDPEKITGYGDLPPAKQAELVEELDGFHDRYHSVVARYSLEYDKNDQSDVVCHECLDFIRRLEEDTEKWITCFLLSNLIVAE